MSPTRGPGSPRTAPLLRPASSGFKARPLADGFLTGLKDAVRDRRPFDPSTGLPEAEVTEDEAVTWYAS